jgi:hypothetical protein
MKIIKCRRCPANIVFLKTAKGHQIPIDIDSLTVEDKRNLDAHQEVEFRHGDHVSHFASCPAAASFRKPKVKNETSIPK